MTPRVLFLTPDQPDYMALTLLHGLRSVLGTSVVDQPMYDSAYRSYPDPSSLYGNGFTAFALLDDVPIDRTDAIEREADYYADLQASRYGITTKKAGWDCMRHYELAANGCVPCFRDLAGKPTTSAPHGLGDHNCVPYSDYADLRRRIDAIDEEGYRRLQAGAIEWARANSTRRRAEWLLSELGLGGRAASAEPSAAKV